MRLHEKLAWYWFAKVSFSHSSRVPPRKARANEIQFWQPSLRTIFEPKPMPHTMTQSSWTTSLWWPKTCDYFAVFPEKSFKSQLEMHFGISGWMCLRLYAYQTDVKKKTDLGICWWMMQHMKHQKTVFNCLLSEGTAKTNLSMTHKYYLMIGCITRERNSTKLTYLSIRNHNLRWLWYIPCSSFVGKLSAGFTPQVMLLLRL